MTRTVSLILGGLFALLFGMVVYLLLAPTTADSPSTPPAAEASDPAFDPQLNPCAGDPTAPAPGALSVTGDCLGSGTPTSLAALADGKPLVVNLWAYWCQPCREEMPILTEFAARYGDKIAVVGIHTDPATARGVGFARDEHLTLPLLADTTGSAAAAFAVPQVLPITVILTPDGEIVGRIIRPLTSVEDLATAVAAALGTELS